MWEIYQFVNNVYSPALLKWFEIFMADLYTHAIQSCQFLKFLDQFIILLYFYRSHKKTQVLVFYNKNTWFSINYQDVSSNETDISI